MKWLERWVNRYMVGQEMLVYVIGSMCKQLAQCCTLPGELRRVENEQVL